jgi:NADH:ubiquinone oxidoreductase subunit 5 (subunit L)/multisubunit Na+/H+ antiporter MnhA subunit
MHSKEQEEEEEATEAAALATIMAVVGAAPAAITSRGAAVDQPVEQIMEIQAQTAAEDLAAEIQTLLLPRISVAMAQWARSGQLPLLQPVRVERRAAAVLIARPQAAVM